ncbi:hypothetical protein VIGAN_10028700 [Vigna angularis var. angularis]|uniref:Uncharacterized protein n=1 Tax=Vigna angularis var. angularis TaxID=157739 RepID=A0A0S3T153_PHAAN|nr:hypothetical protein VIGAN_10028700 [Vigna angularis var. angularis]
MDIRTSGLSRPTPPDDERQGSVIGPLWLCGRPVCLMPGPYWYTLCSHQSLIRDFLPLSTLYCLWLHHSHACPTNLEVHKLTILSFLFLKVTTRV